MARAYRSSFGNKLANDLMKEIGLKTIQSDSNFRKQINKFTFTGDFNRDIKKMISLIEQFNAEYSKTKALLQTSFYLQNDILYISDKINFLEQLIITEKDAMALQCLRDLWNNYRNKF
jgi:tetraacyldisaccharide-1-P 4'-kinase